MPFNRVIEMHSNANMWLRRWRNNVRQQQWWFDEKSKTIRNNYYKTYCIDIQNSGKSSNLRAVTGISSKWF